MRIKQLYKYSKKKKGISLITLIITIIVIIILAGAVIYAVNQNNPLSTANEAVFKENLSEYRSELNTYKTNKYLESSGTYDPSTLNVMGDAIKDVITSMKSEDLSKYAIQAGELVYIDTNDLEKGWINDVIGTSIPTESVSIVNAPVLATGMTPIKWDASGNVVTTTLTDTSWYNYDNKQWANAQTADGSMWVWIPRYEYKIPTPHTSDAQTIDVKFITGAQTVADSGYIVHPAFTFGSTELTGIWVAKFEASGTTSAVDVKPGVTSLRSRTISDMFTASRNMEANSRYGWGTSGSGIDTHLMKNTEWGAVVYLTQSIYGKNNEVWINPNSNFLTGQAGTSVSSSSTTLTYSYNDTTYGVNASTTGNLYGIYDMSGGAREYTAAYVNNGNSYLTTYGSSLVNAASKYKDVYTKGSNDDSATNYLSAAIIKGDAVYEISSSYSGSTSWYSDYAYMPYSCAPFFGRGGYYSKGAGAGLFYFYYIYGCADFYGGFRPVLAAGVAL